MENGIEDQIKTKMKYGFVCIADSLGTKGIWAQIGLDDYIKKVNEIRSDLLKKIDIVKKKFQNDNKVTLSRKHLSMDEMLDIKLYTFSDTYMLFTESQISNIDEDPLRFAFPSIISELASSLFIFALRNKIFLRGAISHGKFYSDDNLFIGPAVDDAASYIDKADWIGLMFTPSASIRVNEVKKMMERNFPDIYRDYPVYSIDHDIKLKDNDKNVRLSVIDWPLYYMKNVPDNDKITFENFYKLKLSEYPIPEYANNKYVNTINFADNRYKEINNKHSQ